ncbi:MAG: UDP-N-acetylmuramate--L-alanine ligase [Candidatus Kapaibacterium sp.]
MRYKSKYLKESVKQIHFIGIGGIGMCGLAEYLLEKGYVVTGSDMTRTFITDRLETKGAKIFTGHKKSNVNAKTDLVVFTSAVKKDNPEYKKARDRGIKTIKRAVLLGDIVNSKFLIAVSGTHGKTTTTSMLAKILIDTGFDPTVFVGGNLDVLGGASYRNGESGFAIVEADEYDRSFLTLKPNVIIINNIELDHVDIYKNESILLKSFADFATKIKPNGTFIINWDDSNIRKLFKSSKKKNILKYGIKSTGLVSKLRNENFKTEFNYKNKKISLNVLGEHNVYNALAAITASGVVCDDSKRIIKSISSFKGVKRRLELKSSRKFKIFDDYAHHPSEIKTTLLSLKDNDKGRIVVVFQPHTFTRTNVFYKEFAESLNIADLVYLLPIYPAREKSIKGVNSRLILEILKMKGCESYLFENKNDLFKHLEESLKRNDRVVFQGAGTITNYCDEFIKKVMNK